MEVGRDGTIGGGKVGKRIRGHEGGKGGAVKRVGMMREGRGRGAG